MNRVISGFLDRLAERLTAIIAGVVSSKVESIRAVTQADQQAQLEDLARQYETDGKHDIARTLRERAGQLTSVNLAGDGVDVLHEVTTESGRLTNSVAGEAFVSPGTRLPDFSAKPPRDRKKRPAVSGNVLPADSSPESSL